MPLYPENYTTSSSVQDSFDSYIYEMIFQLYTQENHNNYIYTDYELASDYEMPELISDTDTDNYDTHNYDTDNYDTHNYDTHHNTYDTHNTQEYYIGSNYINIIEPDDYTNSTTQVVGVPLNTHNYSPPYEINEINQLSTASIP